MYKVKKKLISLLVIGLFAVIPYPGVEASVAGDRSVVNSDKIDNHLVVRGRSGDRVRPNSARAGERRERLDRNDASRERRQARPERRRAVERGRR